MSRKLRKNLQVPEINTRKHPFVGVSWPVAGSKGAAYEVDMFDDGFRCSCYGFHFYGKCKHIRNVVERIVG